MSEDEIKTLIRKRGTIKHKLTSFQTYFKTVVDKCSVAPLSKSEITSLRLRMDKIKDEEKEFDKIQSLIEDTVSEDDLSKAYEQRDTYESASVDTIAQAQAFLSDYCKNLNLDVNTLQPIQQILQQITPSTPDLNISQKTRENVLLPEIPLPQFDGKYESWLTFKDSFESLIHDNKQMRDIEKFHYLRSSLVGSAATIIQSIQFTAQNYSLAWDTLLGRFNNTYMLVNGHIKALHNLNVIKKDNFSQIRSLVDNAAKHLHSLKMLGEPTDSWDTLIMYYLSNKLSKETAREWENIRGKNQEKSLNDMFQFLRLKADLLETMEEREVSQTPISQSERKFGEGSSRKGNNFSFLTSNSISCNFCKGSHMIYKCEEFLKLSIPTRITKIKQNGLCENCLCSGHKTKDCRKGPCRICTAKHSSLLHLQKVQNTETSAHSSNTQSLTMLATAQVCVVSPTGKVCRARALLDCGSQSNFVSRELVQTLEIEPEEAKISIKGISGSTSTIQSRCKIQIFSNISNYNDTISCLVLPKITDNIPMYNVDITNWNIPAHIQLADPQFYIAQEIDLLLGAEIFWSLLNPQTYNLSTFNLSLKSTKLGWIVSGPVPMKENSTLCNFSQFEYLDQRLERFFEIEDWSKETIWSPNEQECEDNFTSTTTKAQDGKFVVKIPLKSSINQLGDSKKGAIKRFQSLERKFQSNPSFKSRYIEFMEEYQTLGHMTLISEVGQINPVYYLPHHGVINNKSTTTKLRVVFDGSASSDSGVSINDLQHIGPPILGDLLSIIFRFRQHQFVVCADVEKMYRQIWIAPDQRHLQLILWRKEPTEELQTFSLNTVTYGTSSAPYLAVRCIQQIAIDNMEQFPKTSQIILKDFYVDDLLTGGTTEEEVIQVATEISNLLLKSGFMLRKWSSNSNIVLSNINVNLSKESILQFGDASTTKTLGLYWCSDSDVLRYKIETPTDILESSKRSMLSEISQIYDPLGLISPCIVTVKIMLQKLWLDKLSWDDKVPQGLFNKWKEFRTDLLSLNHLKIQRKVVEKNCVNIQIHGFADASQDAYGACLYIRSVDDNNKVTIRLLCSRTRVAPLKQLTIPRLELCAALILAQLYERVTQSLTLNIQEHFLYTDSSIVLCWLKMSPSVLQVFVKNRVSKILQLTDISRWKHVRSKHNPADILSRGIKPSLLPQCQLWWQGPDWLKDVQENWPQSIPEISENIPEIRQVLIVCNHEEQNIFSRFSSYMKLLRVTAYCLRFANNCRLTMQERLSGSLNINEINDALKTLIAVIQQESFSSEYKILESGNQIKRGGPLIKLNPFFQNKILYVGGRLVNSNFPFEKKHPIVLPGKHPFTRLLFKHEHNRLAHAPPQLLLASIREQFWPISGKSIAKQIVHQCVRCFRTNPILQQPPLMSNLPELRVTKNIPFTITGVDYAGPILIKEKKGRGAKTIKAYICLFICFAVKAVHIELVGDLTADSFIGAFRRFCSRRGKPTHIYSDNGTNFKRANTDLKELFNLLNSNDKYITDTLLCEGISWHFIPPYSPHFGGLWEAGIKSTKYHLKRIVNDVPIQFEYLSTLLTQIEGILNSRPLTPLSSDPNDLDCLTPAHFLIGRRIISAPDPDVRHIPCNRLSIYQHVQQLQQHFWIRWAKEYISELQVRHKWNSKTSNLQINQMVLIKEPNLHPYQWLLGRVLSVQPSQDGSVRVANIKTRQGVIQRSFVRLCPLPMESSE